MQQPPQPPQPPPPGGGTGRERTDPFAQTHRSIDALSDTDVGRLGMYVVESDLRPPSLLRWRVPGVASVGGGCITVVLVFSTIGVFLTVLALFTVSQMIEPEEAQAVEEPPNQMEFMPAKLVKLGREFDARELPNRVRPAQSTGQAAPSDVPTKARRRVARPDDAAPQNYDNLLERIIGSSDRAANVAREAEQEGDPEGVPEGTATRDEGDLYRTRLYAFFRRGLNRPPTLTDEELRGLSATVSITTSAAGIIASYSLSRPSGNAEFDQAVRLRMDQARGSPIPTPPTEVEDQYLNATFNVRIVPPR